MHTAAIEPDVIFFDGKVVTMDKTGAVVSAVAVKDGKTKNNSVERERIAQPIHGKTPKVKTEGYSSVSTTDPMRYGKVTSPIFGPAPKELRLFMCLSYCLIRYRSVQSSQNTACSPAAG